MELVEPERNVLDRRADALAEECRGIREGEQLGAGDLVDAAIVPIPGSAATATSAMSSTSMNGSRRVPAGTAITPSTG